MSDRFNDSDIKLTSTGDISIDDNGDIVIVSNMEYVEQTILSRLRSASNDWFHDNLGANIEWACGKLNNKANADILIENIASSLTKDKFCSMDDILIYARPIDPVTLGVFIFINVQFNIDPIGYSITMNHLVGPKIQKISGG